MKKENDGHEMTENLDNFLRKIQVQTIFAQMEESTFEIRIQKL